MVQDQLKKAIKLAKKTGDRLLVFSDQDPEMGYVVMSMDEYEKITINKSEVRNLTEEELLDRINRDIAIWKNEQESKEDKLPKTSVSESRFYTDDLYQDLKEMPYNSEIFTSPSTETKKARSHWAIPADRKEAAEEIIEEDRQYLEELTF
jgi:hypothetical protein